MATNIEWTNETWNPTTGCDRISPGCANCYALTLAKRLKAMGQARYQKDGGRASGPGFGLTLHEDVLTKPLSWRTPRRVFVNSMSDLFHEDVPFEFIDRVFAVMALTPQHTYQILTKRPERMREYMATPRGEWDGAMLARGLRTLQQPAAGWHPMPVQWPLPNVWLGVTVENQHFADERIPVLLDTPAAVRFISAEPLLGPVTLRQPKLHEWPSEKPKYALANPDEWDDWKYWAARDRGLDWVIIGGESGPRHRPFNPEWARALLAQCKAAHVRVFVKQLGGARPGNKLEDLPEDLRVREFPR